MLELQLNNLMTGEVDSLEVYNIPLFLSSSDETDDFMMTAGSPVGEFELVQVVQPNSLLIDDYSDSHDLDSAKWRIIIPGYGDKFQV